MPINRYLEKNLYGLQCAVEDTSYVVFNLYIRKLRQSQEKQRGAEPSKENASTHKLLTPRGQRRDSQAPSPSAPPMMSATNTPSHNPPSADPSSISNSKGEISKPAPPLEPKSPEKPRQHPAPRSINNENTHASSPLNNDEKKNVSIVNNGSVTGNNTENNNNNSSTAGAPQFSSSTGSAAPASSLAQVLLPFIRAVNEMEQLPLSDTAQRASRRRFLSSFYVTGLPEAAKKLVDIIAAVNDVIHMDVFETPLPTSQAARSARIGVQSAVRDALGKLKRNRAALEDVLNEINEIADNEEEDPEEEKEEEQPERELEDGQPPPPKKKEKDDTRSAVAKAKDEVYELCDQLYSDLLIPRINVAETLLCARTALAIRNEDVVQFAHRYIRATFKVTSKKEIGRIVFGSQLWDKYKASADYNADDDLEEDDYCVPLSWLTNDVLDECEEIMIDSHSNPQDQEEEDNNNQDDDGNGGGNGDDESGDTKQVIERKALIACRIAVQEIPEQSRYMLDAVGILVKLYRLLSTADPAELEGGGAAGQQLDVICDQLLGLGLVDAEMWLQDNVRNTVMRRTQSGAGSFSASIKGLQKRTMSFGSGGSLMQSISGVLSPKQKKNVPSVAARMGGGDSNDNTQDELEISSLMTSTSGGPNGIAALIEKLDTIMATPSPQSTSESLSITSKLYDTLGRINMFLRRTGMASETKVTGGGKVVPMATDDAKIYLEHTPDEAQGFGKRESVLYEQGCLCYEMWSQQNKVRMELDDLVTSSDDDFFRACNEDLLAGLLARADEYCVVTESRQNVTKRMDRLLVIRIKVYHHSGEVRVLTIPQRTTLQAFQETLAQYLPDAKVCEVSFLDDGDKVRISSDKEFEDLIRIRRNLVLEGISLGSSQLGKSLMSSNELKLELYLDPPNKLTARGAAGALGFSKPMVDSVTGMHLGGDNTNSPYNSLPAHLVGPGKVSLTEMIRQQEAEEARRNKATGNNNNNNNNISNTHNNTGGGGTGYDTGSVDISNLSKFFERKMQEKGLLSSPTGNNNNNPNNKDGGPPTASPAPVPAVIPPELMSRANHNKESPPTTGGATPSRATAGTNNNTNHGCPTGVLSSPTQPQASPPKAKAIVAPPVLPPRVYDVQPMGPDQVVVYVNNRQPPPPAPSSNNNNANNNHNTSVPVTVTAAPTATSQATRNLFLAMGRAKKEGNSGGAGYNTIDPSMFQKKPSTAGAGDSPRGLGSSYKGMPSSGGNGPSYAPNASGRIGSSTRGSVPNASVVVVQPRSKWRTPVNAPTGGSLSLAQHASDTLRSTVNAFIDGDTDEDEIDELIHHPTWERGGDNHVQAILQSEAQQRMRYAGPQKRNAVPLPAGAKGRTPKR